ncbi:signal transducer CD24-like [Macaca nemestrina]|uniref:signal transducer CD24-like n=1 Tax=Macaca nemestrina TaxID=9545 RepID=UPI0039B8321C
MGRAMVTRLGLGLLLLGLLLPTQIYSNQTTVVTVSSNSSQSTSTAPNPANATTKAVGGALQSTASLFVVSLSLLHLYCQKTQAKKQLNFPIFYTQSTWRLEVQCGKEKQASSNLLIPHLLLTQKMLRIPNLIGLENM